MATSSFLSILHYIHESQSITRRELGERTGLSDARISTIVSWLLAQRLICETKPRGKHPGRPATLLSLNPHIGNLVGLNVSHSQSQAVLVDFGGKVLASVICNTCTIPDQTAILDSLVKLVEMVCQGKTSPESLVAIGIGLGGIVNPQTGIVLGWPNAPDWAPGWVGLNVPSSLGARFGVETIWVDDCVRAMGITAGRLGRARSSANYIYVLLGDGIGSGIFCNGQAYEGSHGIAGEIGHVTVDEQGPWCSCGNRGCLETMASTSAVLRRARERLSEPRLVSTLRGPCEKSELTIATLIEAAHAGDKLAYQLLDEAGTYVGKVLATTLNILGSDMAVLGGPLVEGDTVIQDAVQRQVRLHALEPISTRVRIVCDDQGVLAGAHGAALMALDHLFRSPQHLQRLADQSAHLSQ